MLPCRGFGCLGAWIRSLSRKRPALPAQQPCRLLAGGKTLRTECICILPWSFCMTCRDQHQFLHGPPGTRLLFDPVGKLQVHWISVDQGKLGQSSAPLHDERIWSLMNLFLRDSLNPEGFAFAKHSQLSSSSVRIERNRILAGR